jgi:T-complex protein 11
MRSNNGASDAKSWPGARGSIIPDSENTSGKPEDNQQRLGSTVGSTTELDDQDSPNRDAFAYGRVHSDSTPTAGFVLTEQASSQDPPITKAKLSELDIPRIVYNSKLRHDVNFDPDLHFRPNLDGESGHRKIQKANDFWYRLRTQIKQFMADPAAFESELAGQPWRLTTTLQAIGEILGTLVPPEDRFAVEENLNVEHLMQQFRKGVADIEKLGLWLARTLKSHCAPTRDEWVDEMVIRLTDGDRDRDVASLVQGLESLLGVLEAMKLVC